MSASGDPGVTLGTVLGGTYEITRLLGRGGMGAVWEAKHLRLPGKKVAIKVLLSGLAMDSEAYARFRREAEIASRIGHPNIVEVLDFNTLESGAPYLVLEFLVGESLATRLLKGKLPLAQALAVARQIGSALHAAHQVNVVHRDLKPDNVFLCPRDVDGDLADHVKVLDFGISKIRGSQTVVTQEATILGTPQYMAPEQATGKNQAIDARTDVFALGAIVFEMLLGKPAFTGNTLAEVIFQVVYQPPQFLPELPGVAPEGVVAAVSRALAKNPDERFPDMAAFIEALTGRPLRGTTGRALADAQMALARTAAAPTPVDALGSTQAPPPTSSPPARPITSLRLASGQIEAARETERVSRGRGPVWAALGVLVAAGGAFVAYRSTQSPAPPVQPTLVAPPPVVATTPVRNPVANPVAADAGPVAVVAAEDAAGRVAEMLKHHPGAPESMPPEVAADLSDCEKALSAGNGSEARRKAEHAMAIKKVGRAYTLLTESYCQLQDLGGARAYLVHVPHGDRKKVVAFCKQKGIDLEP